MTPADLQAAADFLDPPGGDINTLPVDEARAIAARLRAALSPPPPTDAEIDAALNASDWPASMLSPFVRAKMAVFAETIAMRHLRAREQPVCDVGHAHFTPFYLLSNARRIALREYPSSPNWAIAKDLFAVGSTSAKRICRDAGIDPDDSTIARRAGSEANMKCLSIRQPWATLLTAAKAVCTRWAEHGPVLPEDLIGDLRGAVDEAISATAPQQAPKEAAP